MGERRSRAKVVAMRTMGRIGVTGHQAREGLDWAWTRTKVATILQEAASVDQALTCLAVGTDQLFAEEALAIGIALTAVIPFEGYDRCFEGVGLETYRNLLARSARTVIMERTGTDQEAFLAAGVRVADDSDLLIAVWDGGRTGRGAWRDSRRGRTRGRMRTPGSAIESLFSNRPAAGRLTFLSVVLGLRVVRYRIRWSSECGQHLRSRCGAFPQSSAPRSLIA